MRSSDYTPLLEALADSGWFEDYAYLVRAGKMIILLSNFVGGDRYMRERFQDVMGISKKVGKQEIFYVLTCNQNWAEIQRHHAEQ